MGSCAEGRVSPSCLANDFKKKLTDKVIGEIDEALSHKEQEIMQV